MTDDLAIVIPVLNEADELPGLIASLQPFAHEAEIVFVDGGSADASAEIIRAAGLRLVTTEPGRARQMNAGARATRGEILVFLHADVRLPADALGAIRAAMADERVVAGRFDLAYDTRRWPYPAIAWCGSQRSRLTKIFTGDQTIFVRRSAFIAVGRYPDVALMEDVELSRRLKRRGRLACLRLRVRASTRKCRREGVWRTVALMWLLRTLYALGVAPSRLHRVYYRRDPTKRPPQVVAGPRSHDAGSV
ncbi:MAG: TIGR04283 family arsenosugar biosynthesis glycosyltransferase [Candidatus Rokubacteria bacterium]|nr:TIGR04283 family arsenosugar biosynthesis glycosyltransferase [Candidatus Rokubacteria bacterium]